MKLNLKCGIYYKLQLVQVLPLQLGTTWRKNVVSWKFAWRSNENRKLGKQKSRRLVNWKTKVIWIFIHSRWLEHRGTYSGTLAALWEVWRPLGRGVIRPSRQYSYSYWTIFQWQWEYERASWGAGGLGPTVDKSPTTNRRFPKCRLDGRRKEKTEQEATPAPLEPDAPNRNTTKYLRKTIEVLVILYKGLFILFTSLRVSSNKETLEMTDQLETTYNLTFCINIYTNGQQFIC